MVYVGAVVVLFLFVVMMLDINFARTAVRDSSIICRVGITVGWSFWFELALVVGAWAVGMAGTRPPTLATRTFHRQSGLN